MTDNVNAVWWSCNIKPQSTVWFRWLYAPLSVAGLSGRYTLV